MLNLGVIAQYRHQMADGCDTRYCQLDEAHTNILIRRWIRSLTVTDSEKNKRNVKFYISPAAKGKVTYRMLRSLVEGEHKLAGNVKQGNSIHIYSVTKLSEISKPTKVYAKNTPDCGRS